MTVSVWLSLPPPQAEAASDKTTAPSTTTKGSIRFHIGGTLSAVRGAEWTSGHKKEPGKPDSLARLAAPFKSRPLSYARINVVRFQGFVLSPKAPPAIPNDYEVVEVTVHPAQWRRHWRVLSSEFWVLSSPPGLRARLADALLSGSGLSSLVSRLSSRSPVLPLGHWLVTVRTRRVGGAESIIPAIARLPAEASGRCATSRTRTTSGRGG